MPSKKQAKTPSTDSQQLMFQSEAFAALMHEDDFADTSEDTGDKRKSGYKPDRTQINNPVYMGTTYADEFEFYVKRYGQMPTEKQVIEFAYMRFRERLYEYWGEIEHGSSGITSDDCRATA